MEIGFFEDFVEQNEADVTDDGRENGGDDDDGNVCSRHICHIGDVEDESAENDRNRKQEADFGAFF